MDFLDVKFIKCNSCGGVTSMDGKDSVQIAQENAILKLRVDQLEKQVTKMAWWNYGLRRCFDHLENPELTTKEELRKAIYNSFSTAKITKEDL